MEILQRDVCWLHRSLAGDWHAAIADRHENPLDYPAKVFIDGLPSEIRRVRMLGLPEHAALLLYCHRHRPDLTIEVAGPQACPVPEELTQPRAAIHRMRQFLRSPSLGGFHTFTEHDAAIYRLVHRAQRDQGPSVRVLRAWMTHPARYDLTFLPTLDAEAAAMLLATMVDFRWYVDPQHPDRLARLNIAMGLTPRIQADVNNDHITSLRHYRCALVRRCWHDGRRPDLALPGNFLWRRRLSHGDTVVGDLVAGRTFLAYLARTWAQELARRTMPYLREPLFNPEQLLKRFEVDEVAAYTTFAANRPT